MRHKASRDVAALNRIQSERACARIWARIQEGGRNGRIVMSGHATELRVGGNMDVAKLATPPVDAVKAAFDELYKAAAIDPAANTALGKIIALLGPQLGEPVGEGVAATARKFRTGSGEVTLSAREMDMCRGMKIAPAEYAKDKAQRTSAKKAGGR